LGSAHPSQPTRALRAGLGRAGSGRAGKADWGSRPSLPPLQYPRRGSADTARRISQRSYAGSAIVTHVQVKKIPLFPTSEEMLSTASTSPCPRMQASWFRREVESGFFVAHARSVQIAKIKQIQDNVTLPSFFPDARSNFEFTSHLPLMNLNLPDTQEEFAHSRC